MRLGLALSLLWGLAWPCSARGEGQDPPGQEAELRPLIVLVRQPGDELLMEGVRSEALRFGWEIRDEALEPNALPRDLPVAVIRYPRASRSAHLWIHGAGRHASPVEEWIVRIEGDPEDVLAIRVVEVLRAHFLLTPRAPALPIGREASAGQPERRGAWGSLAAGFAGYGSPGGLAPMGGFVLGAKMGLSGWVAGVLGTLQLGSSTVSEPEGSASLRTFGAMVHVGRQFPLGPRLDGVAGVGAAAWGVAIDGAASPPYVPRSSTAWSVGPSASLGIEHVLSSDLRIGLALHGGVTLPPLSIRFVQREAAHWGAPFALLALHGALQL